MKWLKRKPKALPAVVELPAVADSTLREFVYLDETSVESLNASAYGEILTELRDTGSDSLEAALEATAGANAGLAKAQVASTLRSIRQNERQTVRKSVSQSAFARFLRGQDDRLRLLSETHARAFEAEPDASPLATLESQDVSMVLAAESLERGRLIEVDVDLTAAEIYRVSKIVDAILDIIDSYPTLLNGESRAALLAARPIGELLHGLTGNLVPIEGRAASFASVSVAGRDFVVRDSLLAEPWANGLESRPLVIAGVTVESLYWKDLRRVLFSDSRFRMLCRIAQTGLRENWSKIKLSDVLAQANPDLRDTIEGFGGQFMNALRTGQADSSETTPTNPLQGLLMEYAAAAAVQAEVELNDVANLRITAYAETAKAPMESYDGVGQAFDGLDALLSDASVLVDPNWSVAERSRLRESVAGLAPSSSRTVTPLGSVAYLEVEVIAIYW